MTKQEREKLIETYAAGPARLKAALAAVPKAALQWRPKPGRHTESGAYTAENWLQIYGDHLEGHARQIEANVAQWRATPR